MRLEDYKSSDIEEVIELKGMALDQISAIEKAIWLDNINEACARIANLYDSMQKVRVMKNAKTDEKNFSFLMNKLMAAGVHSSVIRFEHKKTD